MTENKRFKYYKNDSTGQEFTIDNYRTGEFNDNELLSVNESIDLLNELNDENKELRIRYNHIREQSNEFHRIARENANRVGKLKKENEQLKSDLDYFQRTYEIEERGLDIVAPMCTIVPTPSRLELFKENEQLKEENQSWLKTASRMDTIHHEDREYCEKLYKENEQLEQFKNTVFDLIDKKIKETKEIFEDGKIDLITYNDSMIILTGLKEQLKGDVE